MRASGWHRRPDEELQRSCFPAGPFQAARLDERRGSDRQVRRFGGVDFDVFPGVYDTGVDTQLMVDAVRLRATSRFLEVGCGCGAVALSLATRCRGGVGVDINPLAIENAEHNRALLGVTNIHLAISDVFSDVAGTFDVIVCNPPYNHYEAVDVVDQMFWDPKDDMKRRFFADVSRFLRPDGRVFFGWANFADIDPRLPLRLAAVAGLRYVRHWSRRSGKGVHLFLVYEFAAAGVQPIASDLPARSR